MKVLCASSRPDPSRPGAGLAGAGRQRLLIGALLYLLFVLFTVVLASVPALREAVGQPLTSAASSSPERTGASAGLYFRKLGPGGSEQADDAPTFAAPLVHSEVEIAVHGPIARTTVRQYFLNPSDDWLEGVYVFPLPEDSAVDRLTLVVGDRRIEGEIHEKADAKRIYEEAKAEGRHASLLSSERPNVFTTSVANVGPKEAISVEIAYQERVGYDAGWYELRFPLVVAPRYTPGGPRLVMVPMPPLDDAPRPLPIADRTRGPANTPVEKAVESDLFGPVVDPASGQLVPTAAISVTLDAGLPLQAIESPSHPLEIESLPDGTQRVDLASGPVESDRDFVLRWHPAVGAEPKTALFAEEVGGDSFLLASLLPGSEPAAALDRPRDLVLVVDNSGSMFGESMEQAKAAVLLALQRLTPQDRVNVIRFDDETEALFGQAQPATPTTLEQARRFVERLQADGGTEMLPAIETALAEPADPDRLTQIVFVTDGAVSNEDQLFQALSGGPDGVGLGQRRLFTVGIGSAPNSWFMTKAAELGRGSFTFIGSASQVESQMAALFRKLESPAMTDLTARWQGVGSVEMVPARLPDLYVGEPVQLAARIANVPLDRLKGTLVLEGHRGGETWRAALPLERLESAEGISAIWARSRLGELQSALAHGVPEDEVRAQAVPLALKHRLVTRWTSLVAVEQDRVARPQDAALETRQVARALPYGWSYEKIFGQAGQGSQHKLRDALALRSVSVGELEQAGALQSLPLPQTATDSRWRTLVGGLALLGGLILLAFVRWGRRWGGRSWFRG